MDINKLKKIKLITSKLGSIRNIPQFLFISDITMFATLSVKKEILRFKRKNPDANEIDVIISSPGGSADDAYRIIRTLRQNFEKVNIVVPFWAKSAATLLSLGGTKIIMDDFGEFGPLDIQIRKSREDSPDFDTESALVDEKSLEIIEEHSKISFFKTFMFVYGSKSILINKIELSKQIFNYLSDFYRPLLEKIDPYKLGDKKRKLDIGKEYAEKILKQYNNEIPDYKKRELLNYLINGCPDHGFIIDYEEMQKYLPNVVRAVEIGPEYKNILNKLSTKFFTISDEIYIGFVESDKPEISPEEIKIEPIKNEEVS